jgi:hypothetical protein
LGFCGVLAGCDDFVEIMEWAKVHEGFFGSFLELSHGIPSHDTFTRVLPCSNPLLCRRCCCHGCGRGGGYRATGSTSMEKPYARPGVPPQS